VTALILATHNRHKVSEITAILGARYRFLTLQHFPEAPASSEDQSTFAGNAMKKARDLARWMQGVPGLDYRIPTPNALIVADDSGLEVDALKGAPGVHSARFAAIDAKPPQPASVGNSPDSANNAKLLRLLKDVPPNQRKGRFRCAIASIRVKPVQGILAGQTFEGICEGKIQSSESGKGGFGYDPLFIPDGQTVSFAQLPSDVKNRVSHRAQALQKLKRYLDTLGL
jgi:XTP/dITP diphosphohydrolase